MSVRAALIRAWNAMDCILRPHSSRLVRPIFPPVGPQGRGRPRFVSDTISPKRCLRFGLNISGAGMRSLTVLCVAAILLTEASRLVAQPALTDPPAAQRSTTQERTSEVDLQQDMLHWGNGDRLSGHLIGISGDTLTWDASELFADPLQIDLSVLSAIRLSQQQPPARDQTESDQLPGEFRITTTTNDVLTGNILAVTDVDIQFKSTRHGEFRLPRNRILSLQRIRSSGLLFLGPRGLDGWEAHGSGNTMEDWKEEADGSLSSTKAETAICRPLTFPDRCEVEVILESTSMPDFVMSLGGRENENPRVEVWGDELICRCGLDFVELGTIQPQQRKLHLHLFVDFEKQVMAVYSNAGRLLGKTSSKQWADPTRGIIFETVESRLTIKRLRVAEWNGQFPQNLRPGETRLRRSAGPIVYGQLTGFDAGSQTLLFDGQTAEESPPVSLQVPAHEVLNLVLSTEEQKVDHAGKTLVSWKDGGFVSGTVVSLTDGIIRIDTDYSPQPIRASLAGCRLIRLPNSAEADPEPDRLFFEGGSLHGRLTMEDQNSNPIRWKPVGGRNASTLVSRGNARFQRGAEPDELLIDTDAFPDVVFMEGGDVFPCRIAHADADTIQLSSPVVSIARIPAMQVKAVELGSLTRRRRSGFGDPGWKRTLGAAARTDDGLAFTSNGGYGHPDLLTGNHISFRLRWSAQTYGTFSVSLFAEQILKPEHATMIALQLAPTMIHVTDQKPQQQRGMMMFGGPARQEQDDSRINVPERDARIDLLIRDGKVYVGVNGQQAAAFELKSQSAVGRGICFDAAITRVNTRRGLKGNAADAASNIPIRITDFQVENVAGTSVAQFVSEEARERLLTIPRFRRDDPPTHALLAPNGDILRGRLESVTETHVVFESRLETFRFPRERIAGIVWLRSDDQQQTAPLPRRESAVQTRLDNGYMLTLTPQRMSGGQLIGESQVLGECRIPAQSIRDLFLGHPDGLSDVLSYVRWIPTMAPEPEWELPDTESSDQPSELIGTVAEDFELQTLQGDLFKLSDHRDKVVVLDFWASWCGPCIAALPKYIDATSEFDGSDVIFVAVNLEESEERIEQFLGRHNLAPTVALDRGSVVARRFGVTGIPHSVVLGKGSVIKHVTVGLQDDLKENTFKKINALLEEDSGG